MKASMSALDIAHIAHELSEKSIKLDQVYIYDNKNMVIRVYLKNEGKKYLRFELPDKLYLSDHYPAAPERPQSSTLYFRKLLKGAYISKIRVPDLERSIVFEYIKGEQHYQFIAEFFDKGNILVVTDGKIKACLEQQIWSARKIKPGQDYQIKLREQSFDMLEEQYIRQIDDVEISKALAVHASLGGEYANECCIRANINPKALSQEISKAQWQEINNIVKDLQTEKQATIYFKEPLQEIKNTIDKTTVHSVVPFTMQSYENKPKIECQSFNEAIDRVHGLILIKERTNQHVKSAHSELTRTQKVLQKLYTQEKQLLKTADDCNKAGEHIYEHYQDVEQLLKDIQHIEKTQQDPAKVIKEKYPQLTYNAKQRTVSFSVN